MTPSPPKYADALTSLVERLQARSDALEHECAELRRLAIPLCALVKDEVDRRHQNGIHLAAENTLLSLAAELQTAMTGKPTEARQ